jgi:Rad3-related DNA helicase
MLPKRELLTFDECLPGDALVLTDAGSISIKEIVEKRLPVKVLSRENAEHTNSRNRRLLWKSITSYSKLPKRSKLLKITVQNPDGTKSTLRCTDNHRILVKKHEKFWHNATYIEASKLQVGDVLQTITGSPCGFMKTGTLKIHDSIILSIEEEDYDEHVYDLGVEGTHCFFADGFNVHNCHKLESELYSFAEVELSLQSLEGADLYIPRPLFKRLVKPIETIGEAFILCTELINTCYAPVASLLEGDAASLSPKILAKLLDFKRRLDKISVFLQQHEEGLEWITKPSIVGTRLSPLRVHHLHDLAFRGGEKILLMSGTILEPRTFAKSLGISPDEYEYIRVPSTFPPKNNLIKVFPLGSLNHTELVKTFPKVVRAVTRILDHHQAEKGVVQTYSYKIAEMLYKSLEPNPRLLFHLRGTDKAKLLAQHIESPEPTVLIGPGFKEGLDLKDDLCRHQTIVKLPCADLSDPVVKARAKAEPSWYALMTAMDLLQMLGRPVRSETDHAVQYILDGYFPRFFEWNRKLFPKEIQKSFVFPS